MPSAGIIMPNVTMSAVSPLDSGVVYSALPLVHSLTLLPSFPSGLLALPRQSELVGASAAICTTSSLDMQLLRLLDLLDGIVSMDGRSRTMIG